MNSQPTHAHPTSLVAKTQTDLIKIAKNYKPTAAFADEIIEESSEEYNRTTTPCSEEGQIKQAHITEEEALNHWAK